MNQTWFPKPINFPVSDRVARAYIKENIDQFLDFMFRTHGFTVSEYIDENLEQFCEFILSGGAEA